MTNDDRTPDLTAMAARLREAWKPIIEDLRKAWETMKPMAEILARSEATRTAAQAAIGAAYDEEGGRVADILEGLDASQLCEVYSAAMQLAERANSLHIALTTIAAEEPE